MTSRIRDGADRNRPAYWDARFAEEGFAYGTEANDFLQSVVDRLPRGDALCLCEGEGRNAAYLAQRGWRAMALDFSAVALRKAEALAAQRGVALQTQCCDLAGFEPGAAQWNVVTMIFGQPDAAIRRALYARIAACLRPGGAFVLETKAEAGAGADSRYPGAALLCAELKGMEFAIARDGVRLLKEGRYHDGEQYTAQILAFKR
ncbi:MAG TPA: class I SAM-dependent methyltransferase [Usitatibacteraceae bacterium]